MTTTRDVADISTAPGGKSGDEWTADVRASLRALWGLNGGFLRNVAGTNVITATIAVPTGFVAYSDGLRCLFVPTAANTGPVTINISGVGAKALVAPDGEALGAGALDGGRIADIVFDADEDAFRLVSAAGVTNVTVQGGIVVQRSAIARLLSAVTTPTTSETTLASISFQALFADSTIAISGNVSRAFGDGTDNLSGTTIRLYVDGVEEASFTDASIKSQHSGTVFEFVHLPGDTDAHTYEIRCECSIEARYPAGANFAVATEISAES